MVLSTEGTKLLWDETKIIDRDMKGEEMCVADAFGATAGASVGP